jgi:hypothetical protein
MPTPVWVHVTPSEPGEEAFSSARGLGTPIVIDDSSGSAYYLSPSSGITLLGGGSITYLELASGDFSTTSVSPQISPISFSPEPSTTYVVEGQLGLETDSAVKGPKVYLNLPSSLERGFISLKGAYSTSAERLAFFSHSTNPASLAISGMAQNTPLPCSFTCSFTTGAGSTGDFSIGLSVEP